MIRPLVVQIPVEVPSLPENPPDPMKEYRFHASMTAFIVPVAIFSIYGAYVWHIKIAPGQLLLRGALLALLLAGAAFYRWRGLPRAVNLIMMTFWGVLVTNLYLIPEHLAARRAAPWGDALLARMDAALGVEVPDVMRVVQALPAVSRVLAFVYGLLIFLLALAVMVPPMCGRMDKAKEYAVACLFAAAVSIPLVAACPAIGPWSVYGYTPSPEQEGTTHTLLALRSGAPFLLDLGNQDGLICFPSFHTILAVLTAVALWPNRYLRWPCAVLAGLIVLSTLTTGWHYLSDVLGGLVLTAVSLVVARGYLRLERAESWAFWKRAKATATVGMSQPVAPTLWGGRNTTGVNEANCATGQRP
jgi:membrane-associated phospholipid phosphatase